MEKQVNPFVVSGYAGPEYFCNRKAEREELIARVVNGNNVTLTSIRRMGKTGLIEHCFRDRRLAKNYYTFFVDIYSTRSLRDFVFMLSKDILLNIKPLGKRAWEEFLKTMRSIRPGISFDASGTPIFTLQLGEISHPQTTLDEIFSYLGKADRPCIVAVDEFQQVSLFPEKNMEALLRTHVQQCNNARFIFAGSQMHTMANMFVSASRPFYQSTSMLHLYPIPLDEYIRFARRHFSRGGKEITPEAIEEIWHRFEGVTWYLQKILNQLYASTLPGKRCGPAMIEPTVKNIVDSYQYSYSETLFRLPDKQKELLVAIAKEGKAQALTSGQFITKYSLRSASSIQAALKGLLEKDFITRTPEGEYGIYDFFFAIWLRESY